MNKLFALVISIFTLSSCAIQSGQYAENSSFNSSIEIITEAFSENKISSDDELDFWACPNLDSGYIITDSANLLTLEKLYSLICKARYYMMSSEYFSYVDNEWKHYSNSTKEYTFLNDYINEINEKYRAVFTDRLVDNIPKPDDEDYERGSYVYSLGFLSGSADEGYIYGNDRGTDATYCDSDWQIEVVSDTEVRLIHQAFYRVYPEWTEGDEPVYFKDHVLLNQADDSHHKLRTYENRSERLETYYYTLLWEDEHWKFDSFSLWY